MVNVVMAQACPPAAGRLVGTMPQGKCPTCEKVLTSFLLESLPACPVETVFVVHCDSYLCPHCLSVLGVAPSARAIETRLSALRESLEALEKARAADAQRSASTLVLVLRAIQEAKSPKDISASDPAV